MTGRFGPVDADDLVGTTSARLLALGLERRERLTALRLLGLLADHAGADRRIRRHIDDLVAEFDIDPDGLDTSLAALVMAEVLQIDLGTGSMRLIVPSRPAAGGLRAESFLANVARSLDTEATDDLEPVGLRADVDAPRARNAVASASRLLGVAEAGATVRHLVLRERRCTAAPKAGSDDVEIATIHHIPVVLLEPASPRHRRPLRAAAASLIAAVATLVLGASPDFEQRSTSLSSEPALADRPEEVRRPTTTTVRRPATPPSTESEPDTVAPSDAEEATADEAEQTTTPSTRVPGSTAPVARPEQNTTTQDRPDEPDQDPAPGPVSEVPCAPETPVLDVLRISTNETADPIGPSVRGERVAVVRGTAHSSLDEAVVIDAFDVEVLLSDGSTVTSRTTAPIFLAAGQTATWFVEVPIGAPDPELATAHLARWAQADGDPPDAVECTPQA